VTQRELSDVEWALIEPLLPIGRSGPYPRRLRERVEAVIWRFRTGGQWRKLPAEFGPWRSVYDAFARWRDAGVFTALHQAVIAEAARRGQADLSLVSVDSTSVRAHQDAAGMRMDPAVLDALEKASDEEKGRPGTDKPT
jgi:transposase